MDTAPDPKAGEFNILDLIDMLRAEVVVSKEQMDEMVSKAAEAKTATTTRELNAKIKALQSEIASLKAQAEDWRRSSQAKDAAIKKLETNLAERTVSSWL